MSKTKVALIAAVAVLGMASPVLAQTYAPQEPSYRSGPAYNYAPGDRGYSNYYNFYDGSPSGGNQGGPSCGVSC
jgi:hypothetical protein